MLVRTGTSVEVVMELAQPSSVLGMVEAGVGIAVVPQLAAPRPENPALVSLPLAPLLTRTILLLRRRDRSLSPAADAVWTILEQLYRGVPASR